MNKRAHELLAAVSPEWTDSRKLWLVVGGSRQDITPPLTRLLDAGLVERRGLGVIGHPYEWRAVDAKRSAETKERA